jgi:hypothetical protein
VGKEIEVPDADHPITIGADTVRVVARVGDTVVADTSVTLTLREAGYQPVHYILLDDVAPGTLRSSSHTGPSGPQSSMLPIWEGSELSQRQRFWKRYEISSGQRATTERRLMT